jgi:sugar (pentulose or hexulose) kinase
MENNFLVIDVGTQSMRAIIYSQTGTLLFMDQFSYSPISNGIEVEQDPRTFKEALYSVLKNSADYSKKNNLKLRLISVTSQRASIIPMDVNGKAIYNSITWQDRRSYLQCDQVKTKMSMQDIYKKTGLRLDSYFSAPKMMWLKQNMSEIYNGAYKIIGAQDYVIYQLTERFVTDTTQAARTLLMNIHTFEWDDDLIKAFEIDKKLLSEIVKPGTIVGKISKQIIDKTGLPQGLEVMIAGGDQQNAAIGLNVLAPGTLEANIGTGSFVIAYAEKPFFDESMRVLCSASAVPGKWIVEAGLLTSGNIYAWFKDQFYKDIPDGEQLFKTINEEVNKSKPGANGLVLIPHFKGSAAPYWNPLSRGIFFNASLEHTRGDFARAILEGIAQEMAENIERITDLVGYVDNIYAAGGLTKFSTFNQIQADIFNKAVSVYESAEATAVGALISSLVTLGIYSDHETAFKKIKGSAKRTTYHANAQNQLVYRRQLRTKKLLYNAINDSRIYEYMLVK